MLWTTAHQASLSFTVSRSLLKLMSVESVMLSKHLILCHPLFILLSIFPESGSFPVSQFTSGGQSIGTSASASVLPMNIQGWFPLGLTGLISLLSLKRTLKSLFQHHTSKASVLRCSAFIEYKNENFYRKSFIIPTPVLKGFFPPLENFSDHEECKHDTYLSLFLFSPCWLNFPKLLWTNYAKWQ